MNFTLAVGASMTDFVTHYKQVAGPGGINGVSLSSAGKVMSNERLPTSDATHSWHCKLLRAKRLA